jgi:hypothetical protein
VILKSAIFEEPFTPKVLAASEVTKGVGAYPQLQGYVCTTPKARAELPLVSDKGDPLLAHWQYGLGRAVAWTSDAKSRWARNWLSWGRMPPVLVADRAVEPAAARELGLHQRRFGGKGRRIHQRRGTR